MTEPETPFDVSAFSVEAVAAFQKDDFLEWLSANRFFRSHSAFEELCGSLVRLHNTGKIDVIASLQHIHTFADRGHDFWQLQSLYSQIIPDLEINSDALIDGVLILVEMGGQDLAANQPNAALREWLKRRPEETRRLLDRAQQEPKLKSLTFVLEAGATQDFGVFFDAAVDFMSSEQVEDRLAAMTALSRMDTSADLTRQEHSLEVLLSHANSGVPAQEVAQTIGAILDVRSKFPDADDGEIIAAIEKASKQPTPELHYILARSLAHHPNKFSASIKVAIIKALEHADPSQKGVVDQIDFAFSTCLDEETRTALADCLEALLKNPETPLDFDDLDSFTNKLTSNHSDNLVWLVIHWLRFGCHEARECLPKLFRRSTDYGFELNSKLDEFGFGDDELVFIAKKTLGYLFLQPVTAASILISCLNATSNDKAAEEISNLLFDPLMINFSGDARRTVKCELKRGSTNNKYIKLALKKHNSYLSGLRQVSTVPELHPSASDRRVQAERQRQLFAKSFKDAEKYSVLLNFVTKQTLLHGSGSVYYIRSPDGALQRSEMQMASHGTNIEFPRFEAIDPVYLQNIIIRFRNEKFEK